MSDFLCLECDGRQALAQEATASEGVYGRIVMTRAIRSRESEPATAGGTCTWRAAPAGGDGSGRRSNGAFDRRRPRPRGRVTPMEETALHRPSGSERVVEKTSRPDVESLVGRRVRAVPGRLGTGPGHDGLGLQGEAPGPGPAVRAQDHGPGPGGASAGDPRAILGRGPGGRQPAAPARGHDPQSGQRAGVSLHRDGIYPRRADPARVAGPRGPARAGASLDPGPAGRAGLGGRPRRGAGPPRHQAGQRPAHPRRPGQAGGFRPGAPAR